MKSKNAGILFLLLFTTGSHLLATDTDTFRIKGAAGKLQPAEEKFIQYTETKEGLINFNAILTRKIEKTTYHGTDAFLIVQTYQSGKAVDKDSSYCDANTLMPLAYCTDIQSEQHQEKVSFTNGVINNTIIFKDSVQQFTRSAPDFYNGVVTDDLIRLLPLQEKKQFIFKTLNPGMRYFEYMTVVDVEAKEEISLPGGEKVLCWRTRVTTGSNYTLQWYTVKDCHQVKKKFTLKNGGAFIRAAIVV
jgi:hypothetical protein